jgi:hypothetical protein
MSLNEQEQQEKDALLERINNVRAATLDTMRAIGQCTTEQQMHDTWANYVKTAQALWDCDESADERQS